MTPAETLTLAAYFFVLIILAVYGWHRYYLVYLYMRNRDKEPKPGPPLDPAAGRHDPAAALQRDVRRRPADRGGLPHRLSARAARNPGARRLDRRDAQHRRAGGPALRRPGHRHQVLSTATDRTGYKAGALEAGLKVRARRVHRHLRRRLHPDRRISSRSLMPHFARSEGRHGAGALGPHQPGLLAADEDPVDPARRPLRPRARRPQPRRALLQLQRHGRHLAARGDRRRRRLAARHAHRGSRSQLPRAAARLAVRVRARRDRAGRSAGRDERLQVAAAPLGEGLDPDLPQAAAADPARRTCRSA